MPTRGSQYAAAFDVYVPEDYELTKVRNIVPLGYFIALPVWWKANMRPRSGFSAKGMEVEVRTKYRRYNGEEYVSVETIRIDADVLLGLVDSDYRNEVGVIIKAYSLDYVARKKYDFDDVVENHIVLPKGMRVAQMEICGDTHDYELKEVEKLDDDIDRGGGFGHTGA